MKDHNDYDQAVIDTYEEMTGCDWSEAENDESGTYFSRGNWVSCQSIAQALKNVADYYEVEPGENASTTFGDIRKDRDNKTGIES